MWKAKEWTSRSHYMMKAPLLTFLLLSMLYIEHDGLLLQRWLKVLFFHQNYEEKIKLFQFISEGFF